MIYPLRLISCFVKNEELIISTKWFTKIDFTVIPNKTRFEKKGNQ